MPLPFIRQDNACPHMAAAMQHALCGVQQLYWPVRIPDLAPIEHIWDMMKRVVTLSPEPDRIIAELQQWVKMPGKIYCRKNSAPLQPFAYENTQLHCCHGGEGLHCVLMLLFGHPLL